MHSRDQSTETLLQNVVHDLRQPLGNIETSAYLLNRIFRNTHGPEYQHLSTIERQIDVATRILDAAAAELRRLHAQRAGEESLDFTKPETAAVT